MRKRDHRIDNIRFILILLVVFAHLIEPLRGAGAVHVVYMTIYAFPLPAFVFLTGYFARFSWRRIGVLALVYVVFQTIYLLVGWGLGLTRSGVLQLQYFTPDWVMWYLFATVVWMFIVPILKTGNRMRMALTLAASVAIALGAGFVEQIGYFLSLSRILAFAPFFIAGYYARTLLGKRAGDGQAAAGQPSRAMRLVPLALGIAGAIATICVAVFAGFPPSALYNSLPYAQTETGPLIRLGMMVLAACWICLLFSVVPDKRVRAVTYAGAHTLPTYLLHGLVVRLLRATGVMAGLGDAATIVVSLALACAMTLAFGNRVCDKIVRLGLPGR